MSYGISMDIDVYIYTYERYINGISPFCDTYYGRYKLLFGEFISI